MPLGSAVELGQVHQHLRQVGVATGTAQRVRELSEQLGILFARGHRTLRLVESYRDGVVLQNLDRAGLERLTVADAGTVTIGTTGTPACMAR